MVPTALAVSKSAVFMYVFYVVLTVNKDLSWNSINRMIFVTKEFCVFFVVWNKFLNII
jgi:hypothetical protein